MKPTQLTTGATYHLTVSKVEEDYDQFSSKHSVNGIMHCHLFTLENRETEARYPCQICDSFTSQNYAQPGDIVSVKIKNYSAPKSVYTLESINVIPPQPESTTKAKQMQAAPQPKSAPTPIPVHNPHIAGTAAAIAMQLAVQFKLGVYDKGLPYLGPNIAELGEVLFKSMVGLHNNSSIPDSTILSNYDMEMSHYFFHHDVVKSDLRKSEVKLHDMTLKYDERIKQIEDEYAQKFEAFKASFLNKTETEESPREQPAEEAESVFQEDTDLRRAIEEEPRMLEEERLYRESMAEQASQEYHDEIERQQEALEAEAKPKPKAKPKTKAKPKPRVRKKREWDEIQISPGLVKMVPKDYKSK